MMEPERYTAAILDANIGSTNVTSEDKIQQIVFNTFSTITKVLQQHCGPYSSFAITHQVGDQMSEPIFTNDGINIVKSLSFLNPIQDFARRNIAYIGSRVESKVGDGTTTAMILASSFMKHMADPSNAKLQEALNKVSYSELTVLYNDITMALLHQMLVYKSNVDASNKHWVGQVAYCQAYTSSHGDVELSRAIYELFSHITKEAWPYIYYYREGMETTTRYKVKCDTNQFTSKVVVMNKNMLNDRLGTAYLQNSTNVFVYTDLLTVGDQLSWQPLEEAIKQAILEDTPLLVLCPDTTDGYTRRAINDLLVEDTKHNVAVFTHHLEHPKLNDFRILALLTKQPDIQTKYFVLKNVYASCAGHDLVLNSLYVSDPEDEVNPLMKDEGYPLFKQQVEEIKSLIDQAKEDATYRDTVNEITHYVSVYNRLYFCKKWMVVVGGLAYDNSAAMDVLMDTINAVNRSLTEGYTGGANVALCKALQDYLNDCGPAKTTGRIITQAIVESFKSALQDVYIGISADKESDGSEPFKLMAHNTLNSLHYAANHGWECLDFMTSIASTKIGCIAPVIQPNDLIPEVFTRIGEVCLKFLKTANIISINGVYTPPKKKSWFRRLFK